MYTDSDRLGLSSSSSASDCSAPGIEICNWSMGVLVLVGVVEEIWLSENTVNMELEIRVVNKSQSQNSIRNLPPGDVVSSILKPCVINKRRCKYINVFYVTYINNDVFTILMF